MLKTMYAKTYEYVKQVFTIRDWLDKMIDTKNDLLAGRLW